MTSRGDAVRLDDLADQLADDLLGVGPGDGVEHADGAGHPAGGGDDVVGRAGLDQAPHHADAGARVEAAGQDRRQLGDQLAEREGEVLGQVRTGGVPALAAELDADRVGGAGERALAQPDLADVEARVAVQAEDAGDAVEGAAARSARARRRASPPRPAGRAAGPDRQLAGGVRRGQGQAGADQGGGVHVVAAGVGDAAHRLAHGSSVRSSTGSASRSARSATSGPLCPDLGDQSAARHPPHPETCLLEPGGDPLGRAHLAPRQLGVGVQVAPEVDQLVVELLDRLGDQGAGETCLVGYRRSAPRRVVARTRAGSYLRNCGL